MTVEQNKALYRRFIQEAFNEGRLDRLDELLAPDYVFRDAPPGMAPSGRKVAVSGLTMVRIAHGRLRESWVRNDVTGLMAQLAAGNANI